MKAIATFLKRFGAHMTILFTTHNWSEDYCVHSMAIIAPLLQIEMVGYCALNGYRIMSMYTNLF